MAVIAKSFGFRYFKIDKIPDLHLINLIPTLKGQFCELKRLSRHN